MIKRIKNNTWQEIIAQVSRSSNVVTLITSAGHGFSTGNRVTVSCSDSTYDVSEVDITVVSTTQFTYLDAGADEALKSATGYVGVNKVYCGQVIKPNDYYQIQSNEDNAWSNDSTLITDIGNSVAIVNDGTKDFTNANDAINWLKGDVQTVQTGDKKLFVHETSRPLGTYTTFASFGDDQSDVHLVGGGEPMKITHNIGDPLMQQITIDFNCVENKTFVHEGYIMWDDADFDTICFSVVPKTTAYTPGTNTFFNLYNGYLVVPAAGDGMINVAPQDMNLVYIPYSIDDPTKRAGLAFWNADYNTETHQFENITPAPMGDGAYNMFGAEITLERIAQVLLLRNGFLKLQTADIAELGHGMRIRFGLMTNEPDHKWKAAIILTLNREHSCSFS